MIQRDRCIRGHGRGSDGVGRSLAAVEVENVTATEQDANKRFVTDLEKDDFVLREVGVVQDIRYFRRHTDVALNVGLLVDTSGS